MGGGPRFSPKHYRNQENPTNLLVTKFVVTELAEPNIFIMAAVRFENLKFRQGQLKKIPN